MSKKLAILAVATFWLLGIEIDRTVAADSQTQKPTETAPATSPSTGSGAKQTTRKTGITSTRRRIRRTSARRRRRYYNPWRLSSFGEPGAADNPAGDDPYVRQAAIEALGRWNGSIVVVNPNSGRILSMVNQRMALSSGFTPCSTFKPVVALAGLKEGIITPTTKINVSRRQRIDLTEALAKSNNIYFLKLGEMLGFRKLAEYAHEFGLDEQAGANIPGESPGHFPASPPKDGGVGYLAYCGHDMEVTPLQMAAMISSIANGGTLYELQYPRTADEVAQFEPKVRRRLDNLVEYLPQVKEGLAAAVVYGTGRLAYDPAMQIYGKTGTCSEDGARLGWFVSYAEDLQPKYVVVVLLRGGRMMFGPHAAEIAGHLYHDLLQHDRNATQANRVPTSGSGAQR